MTLSRALRSLVRDVLVNSVIASAVIPQQIRWRFLRLAGIDVDHVGIAPHCFFGGTDIHIQRRAFLNRGVFLDGLGTITIGEHAYLAMDVMLLTGTHDPSDPLQRAGEPRSAAVHIGAGAWIGARATILPGVTVGDGCVIAAGSLVTRDCEPHGLYAGAPARRVRELAPGSR